MLKKMLLFIAISSSFLPVFGETNEQRIEALEQRIEIQDEKIAFIENAAKLLATTMIPIALCLFIKIITDSRE